MFKPSGLSSQAINDFVEFVVAGGEINPATMPALVAQAISLVTLHQNETLIGTAAIKMPFAGHHQNEFAKANVAPLAASYPYELGWVVVDSAYRKQGHGRTLVSHAIDQLDCHAVYATTKSNSMRTMLSEFGFRPLGDTYPSELDPKVLLSLYGREVS